MIKPVQVLGQPAMWLRSPDGAEVTVLLHGGQLVSWIPAGDQERLYLSPDAVAGPGQAVRGGIPVVFPQFAQQGPLPSHGFARDRVWDWVEGADRGGVMIGVLRLVDDEATRSIWPHRFEAELSFSFAGLQLDVELAITVSTRAAITRHMSCAAMRTGAVAALCARRSSCTTENMKAIPAAMAMAPGAMKAARQPTNWLSTPVATAELATPKFPNTPLSPISRPSFGA